MVKQRRKNFLEKKANIPDFNQHPNRKPLDRQFFSSRLRSDGAARHHGVYGLCYGFGDWNGDL